MKRNVFRVAILIAFCTIFLGVSEGLAQNLEFHPSDGLYFGRIIIGEDGWGRFKFYNNSDHEITVTELDIIDDPNNVFSFTVNKPSLPFPLDPEDSSSFSIVFNPSNPLLYRSQVRMLTDESLTPIMLCQGRPETVFYLAV